MVWLYGSCCYHTYLCCWASHPPLFPLSLSDIQREPHWQDLMKPTHHTQQNYLTVIVQHTQWSVLQNHYHITSCILFVRVKDNGELPYPITSKSWLTYISFGGGRRLYCCCIANPIHDQLYRLSMETHTQEGNSMQYIPHSCTLYGCLLVIYAAHNYLYVYLEAIFYDFRGLVDLMILLLVSAQQALQDKMCSAHSTKWTTTAWMPEITTNRSG